MASKFNRDALLERLQLERWQLEQFIDAGLLYPDGWTHASHLKKLALLKDGLTGCVWSIEIVEHFEDIVELTRSYNFPIHEVIQSRLSQIHKDLSARLEELNDKLGALRHDQASLRARLERRETLIDARYFCEATGYKLQTFRNSVRIHDGNPHLMRLEIPFYKDLFWHKIKGKWQTSLQDFLDLRSGFNYDIYLKERKRRGEFQPRVKGVIDEKS